MSQHYQEILLDLLTRSMAEFTKINADLAATNRSMKQTGDICDQITGQARPHEQRNRIEFSAFAPQGRV